VWFIEGSPNIPIHIRNKISLGDCLISIASLWELSIKINIGKFRLEGDFQQFLDLIWSNGFEVLPIRTEHLCELLKLPLLHKDPFDRLIIATSVVEKLPLLTSDENIYKYSIECLW
jgi:PIN domain nuclease of toxin-antitoxin system